MQRKPAQHWLTLCITCVICLAPAAAIGQTYPLLEEINRQTQSLYRDIQGGIVRVQLPVPRWVREAAATNDPLKRWDKFMDPAVRLKLEQQRAAAHQGLPIRITPVVLPPTTRPATRPATGPGSAGGNLGGAWTVTRAPGGNETILEPRGAGSASIVIHAGGEVTEEGNLNLGGPLRLRTRPADGFVPNNIGLLLDDAGHVLVPLYVERETLGDAPVRVMVQDVQATATFVGADDKTNLTILKLERPLGRPIRMSPQRPAEGSLVMLVNPNTAAGRLALWTANDRDYGIVVGMDGTVAGVARFGQFLALPAAHAVVEQLIRVGRIQRAILGARLTEIQREDPARRTIPALGELPALVVEEVTAGSLAETSGLRAGDLVLQIGGVPVGDLTTFAALSARSGPTTLTILRAGEQRTLSINLQPPE